jgi:6-phosphogluconolactonase
MQKAAVTIYESDSDLLNKVCADVLNLVKPQISSGNEFNLALTGGTLGVALAKELASKINSDSSLNWGGLNIWWSDERFVPLDSSERNDLEFVKVLSPEIGVKVHRASASGAVDDAALALEKEIAGKNMDLIILGMGPDGHVASLFPGMIHENEARDVFEVKDSPKPPSERVTFSLKKINSAKEIWLIATGEAKSQALIGTVNRDTNIPASHVKLTRILADSKAYPL